MQITKNTSFRKSVVVLIIKLSFIIVIIIGTIFLLNQIDFPAPKKEIEQIISNENFKIVK